MTRQSLPHVNQSVNIESAEKLIHCLDESGASFVPVALGGKKPIEDGWHNRPWSAERIATHKGNIGVLLGKPSNGIICIDLDVNATALKQKYSMLAKTLAVFRQDAPERAKFFLRVRDQLPRSRSYKPKGTTKPVIELLSTGRQAVVIGRHVDGCDYINNGKPIVEIDFADLAAFWRKETGNELDHPTRDKFVKIEKSDNPLALFIKEHWTTLKVAQHFGLDANGTKRESNGELRLLGNGGLLIDEGRDIWRDHSNDVGGDSIALYTQITRGCNKSSKAEFVMICKEMADLAGVELPAYKREIGFDADAGLAWANNPHSFKLGRYNYQDRAIMATLIDLMIKTRKKIVKLSVRDAAEATGMTFVTAAKTLRRLTEQDYIKVAAGSESYLDSEHGFDRYVGNQFEARQYELTAKTHLEIDTVLSDSSVEYSSVQDSCPVSVSVLMRYRNHEIFHRGSKVEETDLSVAQIGVDVVGVLAKESGLTSDEISKRIGRTQAAVAEALGHLIQLGIVERYREGKSIKYHLIDSWEDIIERMVVGFNTYGNTARRKIVHLTQRINMAMRALTFRISVSLANQLNELVRKWGKLRSTWIDEHNRLMENKSGIFAA